jgi:hypothetical protein
LIAGLALLLVFSFVAWFLWNEIKYRRGEL